MNDSPSPLPATPIRLIAFDLDGTVLGHDQVASPRVRAAIRAAAAQGIAVTIATGRNVSTARKYAHELGVNAPVICSQGGELHDFKTDRTLFSLSMDDALACEVIDFGERHPHWHTILYHSGQTYIQRKIFEDTFYARLLSDAAPRLVPSLREIVTGTHADKLIFAMEAEHTPGAIRALREFVGDRAIVVQSHAMFAEVNPLGAHKGAGLARLAARLGIPREAVMAIGDQENDVTMLLWAGLGVAMGQGPDLVKHSARWVAPSIDEDGAAVAIERFVLNQTPSAA